MATRNKKSAPLLLVRDAGGRVLCERCSLAEKPLARMRGLLGRRYLDGGEGMLLRPAAAIHTAFMRFPIDAVFLDDRDVVVHVARNLHPWRMAASRGARAVLELPIGSAAARDIEPGERLELVSLDEPPRPATETSLPPREENEKSASSLDSSSRQVR